MKKLILALVAIATLSLSTFGQAPEGFKYQAVVRDAGNLILNNQAVGMRMTIQQGSIGGATVYQETFAPTTNAYGIVNLEIGSGTVVSGTFANIDWSAGPYFIETAVDVTGGTSYIIMGTSQLMSMPYALYAKTAENVTNDNVDDADADPNNEIQTISRTGTTVTLSSGGTFEDSLGVYTAGTGIDITNNVVSTTSLCGLSIGDTYQGGIIFYLDQTGCHGLVSAPNDIGTALWWDGIPADTKAHGSGLFEGKYNSMLIEWNQGGTTSASAICSALILGGYDDWYLPSIHELNLMYLNIGQGDVLGLGNIGGFNNSFAYWSSTEINANDALRFVFATGVTQGAYKPNPYYVHPVRSF